MNILAIETSCDDTSISLVKCEGDLDNIVSTTYAQVVSSQIKIHKKYGGVVPSLASREHEKNIDIVLKEVIKKANIKKDQVKDFIDAIAVTTSPGLLPSLLIGVNFAKSLSYFLDKPIISVNHLLGHICSNFISLQEKNYSIKFNYPAVTLLVSGGHTQLYTFNNLKDFQIKGETKDDAAGECFDKIAKMLNLGYPGGPAISKEAMKIKNKEYDFSLPRPMMHTDDFYFSFSGLKTAVMYLIKKLKKANKFTSETVSQICYESEQAICEVLTKKTINLALQQNAKAVFLSGGVSANSTLKEMLKQSCQKYDIQFIAPEIKLTMDNATMIGIAGYVKYLNQGYTSFDNVQASLEEKIF